MATYAIPGRYLEGFKRLASMSDDEFERLAKAAADASPSLSLHGLYHDVAERAGLPYEEANELLEAVFSAGSIAWRDSLSAAELSADLASDQLEQPVERFQERLRRLLVTPAIAVTVRAVQLIADEHLTVGSRVITDVRAVFPEDADEDFRPKAALVLHSLRLDYLEHGEHRTFVTYLDKSDIVKLRRALDRADRKAKSLEEALRAAGVEHLEAGDE